MTADPQRPNSPPDTCVMGEEDMMSFIRTHIESILEPYAENVHELHKTVLELVSNVGALQEQSESGLREQHAAAARMDGMQAEQDKLLQFAESTRQFLDGFILEESGKIEQEAEINQQQAVTLQNLQETLAEMKKDIDATKIMPNIEQTLTLMKNDMKDLQKNGEDLRAKLVVNQDTEWGNFRTCVQLKNEIQSVADDLKRIDKGQADVIISLDSHKSLLHAEIMQNKENKELQQRSLHENFMALNGEITNELQSFNERVKENQSQLKQFRNEFEEARDATNQSLSGIKDELSRVPKETQAKLDRIDTDLRSQICAFDAKGVELNFNLHELLVTQGQQQKQDMKEVRCNLGDLKATASKHEGEVAALQTATGVLPGRVHKLEQEAKFTNQRNQRLEETLGLEPLDPKAGIKKGACSGFLGEDQLQRLAFAAWVEVLRDAKQSKLANCIPTIQEMLKMQQTLIESEKSKLHSTNDRMLSLEVDHTKLSEELQKLRKSLELNDGYWKGMTRGLQVAKRTMHTEGDGEMIPSATRLRNALPPLGSLSSPLSGSPPSARRNSKGTVQGEFSSV
eukprot:gnl/MRDRNA2_/MRDRNA2_83940_c0_seq13.p1 gnl/MRDRNA2_/MRDRNA2_83940_c0~~gnl/MRDRNA2_/MRDRNA2_83940_c0_seq13.p1  ORF type:complete len:600 (-),score=139.98 gnl/MRDRNA2_/MRDRNA2_83940_c0_seq13:129-1835(-)